MAAAASVGVYEATRTGTLGSTQVGTGTALGAVGGIGAVLFIGSAFAGAEWNEQCEQAKSHSTMASASPSMP